ncbi:MAG: hypothetical protein PHD46_05860 [Eubacteriales bacterium]|nr:hypothetical protein [Eubacteriales bacterium]MDD4422542.1 hypothetical protein [Eubacteriales bacterium]
MKSIRKTVLFIIAATILLTFSSCTIGSKSYADPWEIDPDYQYYVVYNALGGTINILPTRTAYYKSGDLIKKPEGSEGMLTTPIKEGKIVIAWYTAYENTGTAENPVYEFKEEDRWDFDKDRISDENTDESKGMTLYACWIDPPTLYFVDADDIENDLMTWPGVTIDEPLSRPTYSAKLTIQKGTGEEAVTYTLLDYYFDKECTQKVVWGEGTRTVEEIIADNNEDPAIMIYCKYIEGEYTRINSVSDFKNMDNLGGRYILANDIDFKDEVWKPLEKDMPFSGTIIGNGYSLENINIDATNRVRGVAAAGAPEKSYGLFMELKGARFTGVNFKNAKITVGSTSNSRLCAGVFGGRASETTFENCTIDDITVVSEGEVKVIVSLGSGAYLDDTCKTVNCEFPAPNTEGLEIDAENLIIGGKPPVIE